MLLVCHAVAQCMLYFFQTHASNNIDNSEIMGPKMGTKIATKTGGQKTPYLQSKTLSAAVQHDISKERPRAGPGEGSGGPGEPKKVHLYRFGRKTKEFVVF